MVLEKEMADRYPSAERIGAFAARLAESDAFRGAGLAEAFYDWSRDSALLYEGDERMAALEEAWEAEGLGDAPEGEDPQGWRMWLRFTLAVGRTIAASSISLPAAPSL